jgi:hypothetical protein
MDHIKTGDCTGAHHDDGMPVVSIASGPPGKPVHLDRRHLDTLGRGLVNLRYFARDVRDSKLADLSIFDRGDAQQVAGDGRFSCRNLLLFSRFPDPSRLNGP